MLYIQAITVLTKLVFWYGILNISQFQLLLLMKEACGRSSLFFVPYKRLANSSDRYTGNCSWSKPETTVKELIIRTGPSQSAKQMLSIQSFYLFYSFVCTVHVLQNRRYSLSTDKISQLIKRVL